MKVFQCLQFAAQTVAVVEQRVETVVQRAAIHGKTYAHLAGPVSQFLHERRVVEPDAVGREVNRMAVVQRNFDQVEKRSLRVGFPPRKRQLTGPGRRVHASAK